MKKSITPVLFGTTAGLELKFLPSHGERASGLQDNWIELRGEEFNLSEVAPVIFIQRREVNGSNLTWIGGYWAAREIGYARPGGYTGAGFWLENVVVDHQILINVLKDLYASLSASAMSNGQFIQKLAETKITRPQELPALISSESTIKNGLSVIGQSIHIQVEGTEVLDTVSWALTHKTAEVYSSIYIGSSSHYNAPGKSNFSNKIFVGLLPATQKSYELKEQEGLNEINTIKKEFSTKLEQKERELNYKIKGLTDTVNILESEKSALKARLSNAPIRVPAVSRFPTPQNSSNPTDNLSRKIDINEGSEYLWIIIAALVVGLLVGYYSNSFFNEKPNPPAQSFNNNQSYGYGIPQQSAGNNNYGQPNSNLTPAATQNNDPRLDDTNNSQSPANSTSKNNETKSIWDLLKMEFFK